MESRKRCFNFNAFMFFKSLGFKKVEINRKENHYFLKKQILKFIKINGWYENR
jgi:hypothetical protein